MKNQPYVYGRHSVAESLRSRPRDVLRIYVASGGQSMRLADLIAMAKRHGIAVIEVGKRKLIDLVGDVPHQGVVAAVAPFAYVDFSHVAQLAAQQQKPPLLLALDQVQDPHNVGALVRSAYALGCDAMVLPRDRACEITPAVVRASAGATAHLPVSRVSNLTRALQELQREGFWLVGTVASSQDSQALHTIDFLRPTVIIVGSEGKGVRRLVAQSCDTLAYIPMAGNLGSLNASVAGGICLYEAHRQRSSV